MKHLSYMIRALLSLGNVQFSTRQIHSYYHTPRIHANVIVSFANDAKVNIYPPYRLQKNCELKATLLKQQNLAFNSYNTNFLFISLKS